LRNTVYTINKGINRPIEFKGLKAQYLWWLAGGLVGLLVLFAILYLAGVYPPISLSIITIAGMALFIQVYRLSRQYGQYGLMKKMAARNIPELIHSKSRKLILEKRKL
jgi:hypothetical protein